MKFQFGRNKFLAGGLMLFSAVAVAAAITLEQVNEKLVTALQPYNNQNTVSQLKFTSLSVDAERALKFGVDAVYSKTGSKNKIEIKLQNIGYEYGDGTGPKAQGRLQLSTDFVKAFGRGAVNGIGEAMSEVATQFAKSFGDKYGEALEVTTKTTSLEKDQKGNIVKLEMEATAKINFEKLPGSLKPEGVEFKVLTLSTAMSPMGAALGFELVMNPQYKGFEKEGVGLKEYIEKILNEDAELYRDFASVFALVDMLATKIVETDNSEAPQQPGQQQKQ